ncbi:hypothetical protein D3C72_915130 [compost metagenome]
MKTGIIKLQTVLLGIAGASAIWLMACEKYTDPVKPDVELPNHYCNDPIAANYNRGFPGIPDSTVCEYATEYFEGTWEWVDSIFDKDMTFQQRQVRNLIFTPKNLATDTFRNHLTVSGFCDNSTLLKITANKYAMAMTDTLIPNVYGGQISCNSTDTVSGYFKRTSDTLTASMNILLTENRPAGVFYHKGKAVKQ